MKSLADQVRGWRPGTVTRDDVLDAAPARALAAVLDRPVDAATEPGAALPPLWHWLYFLDWPPRSALGEDGHPAEGEFLPPVPNRRRMFAGGRLHVHTPLRTGTPATRVAEVSAITPKTGTTGDLLFVTVRTEYRQDGALCLVEEQDLVYRSATSTPPRAGASAQASSPPPEAGGVQAGGVQAGGRWRMEVTADPPLLFRFSALTANTHRIHYDQDYTRDVEGYPGLVVHGPLLAVLMAELPRRHAPARAIDAMTYRFRRPVFAGEPMLITGDPATGALKVLDTTGTVRAEATATFAAVPPSP